MMKKNETKQWLPHVIAVLIFFVLTAVYFAPVFQGKDLMQGDAISSQAWGKDAKDYHEATGDYAYWSNSMFAGMPSNYTFAPQPVNIFELADKVLTLNMFGVSRRHVGAIFLTFICFYIFLLSIGCRSWLSVAGSIAYTLCSYNFIIIGAGHMSKSLVMATMAPVIGGVILCYRGKLLWGALITLLFSGLNIYWGHQQISYYLLLVLIVLAIVYLVYAVREKWLNLYLKATGVLIIVAVLALLPALGQLIPSADYAKDTMRGGSVLKQDGKESAGLDIDYAYQWSYGIGETMTLLIPNMYGASSHYDLGTDSELYRSLSDKIGRKQAGQFCTSAPTYWGDQPFTSGPVYVGAIVCFLFVLGLLVVRGREKWWLLAATILSIVMAWGRFFPAVNEFLFYNLPLYSKFRAPSMALVIASLTMVTLGILAVKRLFEIKKQNDEAEKGKYLKSLYVAFGVTGGFTLLLALFGGGMFDFAGVNDSRLHPVFVDALIVDRADMLTSDAWRSFMFIAAAFVLLFAYLRMNFKAGHAAMALAVLFLVDLWVVDRRFLDYDDFMPKKKSTEILPTAADRQILQDKDPNYRVLNLASNTFNESYTSYFHKSVGGYSPAKLRRYQDIIDHYFSGNLNMGIINMLNVRYVIVPSEESGTQVQYNSSAMGNCWFVDRVEWVDSPDAEIAAIAEFNPREVAFVDKMWQSAFENPHGCNNVADSTAYIRMSEYRNPGNIFYESYSPEAQLAVFSEVYYKTWKAFIDGKEVTPVRANYILRALPIPPGEHKIEFRCVDELMISTAKMSLYGSILVGAAMLFIVGAIIYRRRKNEQQS